MKHILLHPIIAVACCLCLVSCGKQERVTPLGTVPEPVCHCGYDDALQQLEWLRNTVNYMETYRGTLRAEISICKYDGGNDGFLTNYCVSCPDGYTNLHDCEGNILVSMGGIAGEGYDVHDIDPASVRCIYRNFSIPRITDHRWYLARFVDRATNTSEAPMWNGQLRHYWLQFNADSTVTGGGVNHLWGTYAMNKGRINIHIQATTEIYDATGWEERMLNALNNAIECSVGEDHIRIYYNYTNTYMEFRASDKHLKE